MGEETICYQEANALSISKRKLLYGVGVNDSLYKIKRTVNGKVEVCPFYLTWSSMLKRCYSKTHYKKHPTYVGCTVCTEWHIFSTFKAWMKLQDYVNKELDKDLLFRDNKIYSPEKCIFVSQAINNLIKKANNKKSNTPTGVCWDIKRQQYKSCCNVNGKQKTLGYFKTEELAYQKYKECKKEVIICLANQQQDTRLKDALLTIAKDGYYD